MIEVLRELPPASLATAVRVCFPPDSWKTTLYVALVVLFAVIVARWPFTFTDGKAVDAGLQDALTTVFLPTTTAPLAGAVILGAGITTATAPAPSARAADVRTPSLSVNPSCAAPFFGTFSE